MLESKAERVRIANSIERINLLRHIISRTRKADVTEWRVIRRPFLNLLISMNWSLISIKMLPNRSEYMQVIKILVKGYYF